MIQKDACVTFLEVEGLQVTLYGPGGQCVHRGGCQTSRLATPRPIFDLRFLFWLAGKVVLVSLGSSF